jgi:hypothetical protein
LEPGVQAQPLEEVAAEAEAVPLAQRRAAAPSALPVEVAVAEHAVAEAAAVVPRAVGVAAVVVPPASEARRVAAAGERVSLQAEPAEQSVLRAAARPSGAPWAFHPARVLPWPVPPPAARFAHAMQRSQIAPPTAR